MKQSSLDRIRNRVSSDSESDLFSWIDVFMHEYGMSLEQFKELNIQAFYLLQNRINERYKKQEQAMKRKK